MATTTCELQWLTYLLQDLHLPLSQPATLYCDNKFALQIAFNQVFYERTKHIEIDCHLICEKYTGLLKLQPITSAMQVADIFTKAVTSTQFCTMKIQVGHDKYLFSSLRGDVKITYFCCLFLFKLLGLFKPIFFFFLIAICLSKGFLINTPL